MLKKIILSLSLSPSYYKIYNKIQNGQIIHLISTFPYYFMFVVMFKK